MYKLLDKEFSNATDALDHYIRHFQISNFKHMETSVAKSTTKEYRLDKLENLMNSNLRVPIFNNLIASDSNRNSTCSSTDLGSFTEEFKSSFGSDSSLNAINQVEKLINNLTSKVDDYSRIENRSQSKILPTLNIKPNTEFTQNKPEANPQNTNQQQQHSDLDDPIVRSILKFEDLNKQLSSKNLFSKIESSIPVSAEVKALDSNLKVTCAQLKNIPDTKPSPCLFEKHEKSAIDIAQLGIKSGNFINECLKILN